MTTGAGSVERIRGHRAVRTLLLTDGELEAWLLDERSGASQHLNTAAAAVWALLEGPMTVDELVAELADTFGLDHATASDVVEQAIDVFRAADLVESGDPGRPGSVDAEQPSYDEVTVAAGQEDLPPTLAREPDP